MKNIPPLTTLKCFEAAARLGSVTRAARELREQARDYVQAIAR